VFQSSPVTKDGRYAENPVKAAMAAWFQSSPVTKDGRYRVNKNP